MILLLWVVEQCLQYNMEGPRRSRRPAIAYEGHGWTAAGQRTIGAWTDDRMRFPPRGAKQ